MAASTSPPHTWQLRVLDGIGEVSPQDWNALVGDYPFLQHEFLAALEHSGCVSARTGWTPQHLALFDARGLAAAAAVLPVLAQTTARLPSSIAFDMAMVMPRSLNDPVGFCPSYLR